MYTYLQNSNPIETLVRVKHVNKIIVKIQLKKTGSDRQIILVKAFVSDFV